MAFGSSKQNNISALAIAVASALTVSASAVQAQEEAAVDEKDVEKVVVTGSRIARDPNLASPSPVQAISEEDIQLSGEFSVTDVINDIPALFSSTTAESSIDSGFADGANILNLRGLGSNRTLTLVNGRRHVGGVAGSAAVDVGSIPVKLIKSVEVLTGGASAVYGADAVTGVVNFILQDDYEGFEFDVNTGISSEGDGEQISMSALYGENFDNDRGNFAINVEYQNDEGVRVSERDNGLIIGSARDWNNPALRFQQGDIGASTPNLAQYYNYDNTGLFNFGLSIPSQDAFIQNYVDTFGTQPNLTSEELALFNRAATANPRAVLPYRTFPFTSGYGYIIPGNPYTFEGFDPATNIDLDGNGTPDCLDSFSGYNSSFGAASFGALGGCWNVLEDGSYRPIQDGLVSGNFEGFGGDSYNTIQQQRGYLITPNDKIAVNLLGHYDLTDTSTVFGELKYVVQTTENESQPSSYWDLLFGAADNPYLPSFIQPLASEIGGVAITADPIGIGQGKIENERRTLRGVIGLEGFLENDWQYSLALNYGRFEFEQEGTENIVVVDRFFSAIDAVTDPSTGEATCRVNLDADTPQVTTAFNIPVYDPGYFSFTPGDGSCVPLNIWAGAGGISQEAVDWVTQDSRSKTTIEQFVVSGSLSGDSSDYFELPYGPVFFALGGEYRKEKSEATFDNWQLGIIPEGSQYQAGTLISEYSSNNSLVFQPSIKTANETGDFDVSEVFVEVSIPLIEGEMLAEELTLDLAARYSDYSTIGDTTTWRANLMYAPYEDLMIRLSQSQAVRAPNITELFGPEVGTTFRPTDPCNASVIAGIRGNDPAAADQIQANCVADFQSIGYNPFNDAGEYVYTDPLSAAFPGVTGGNPELQEETADTTTVGFVYQASWLEGLSVTADYWSIEIESAISSVSSNDIVNGCYIGENLNENFCSLFTRNTDANSPQFGGLNFLRSTQVNFARLETSGVDFSVGYDFEIDDHTFLTKISGTKVNEIDQFTNPNDLNEVNPELGEVNRPEWAGNFTVTWKWQDLQIGWQTQYMDEQLVAFVEIEEYERGDYDDSVVMDKFFQHDINFSYVLTDTVKMYGGIKNVTNEEPFLTNFAYPASARGRFYFVGFDMQLN
ncbi:TonB-dependent receptor [Alteromonas mediterranea]|uniref:TonB-dependent receptor n=1 Tax=Alteromonas mediterranea TaxID=314275 RepID=UPI0032B2FBA6|tara:strand:+ start:1646 stop:5014 length:3369 start_codon:yes stop_codon:yes gene_type:complete